MSKELKTRFEISADELEYRMLKQQEMHIEPGQKAVQILEAALDKVLTGLGVNVEDVASIPAQQEALGIFVNSIEDERMPNAMGIYVSITTKNGNIIPYAWCGDARLASDGKCYCDIQFFQTNRLIESGGTKIIK